MRHPSAVAVICAGTSTRGIGVEPVANPQRLRHRQHRVEASTARDRLTSDDPRAGDPHPFAHDRVRPETLPRQRMLQHRFGELGRKVVEHRQDKVLGRVPMYRPISAGWTFAPAAISRSVTRSTPRSANCDAAASSTARRTSSGPDGAPSSRRGPRRREPWSSRSAIARILSQLVGSPRTFAEARVRRRELPTDVNPQAFRPDRPLPSPCSGKEDDPGTSPPGSCPRRDLPGCSGGSSCGQPERTETAAFWRRVPSGHAEN